MKNWEQIKEAVFTSPGLKTLFSAVIPIFAALLSGSFIFEITTVTGLMWKKFYTTYSFYGLLILVTLIYVYQKALYNHETAVNRFSNAEYCMAYVRSKCLPEMARAYKDRIRDGNGGEFLDAMTELKKGLK